MYACQERSLTSFVKTEILSCCIFLDCTFKKFSRASSMDDVGGSATNADAAFRCHQDSIAICTHLRT